MKYAMELIRIAKSDLKSSEILYQRKQYRNSFYLFQQASEKACKAYAFLFGDIKDEKGLRSVSHKVENMHIKNGIEQLEKMKDAKELYNVLPDSEERNYLGVMLFYIQGPESIETIKQIFNPPNKINRSELLRYLSILKPLDDNKGIIGPEMSQREFKFMIVKLNRFYKRWNIPEKQKSAFLQTINSFSDNEAYQFMQLFTRNMNALSYVMMVLMCSTIITSKHYSAPRYPQDGESPINFYTKKLPVIELQPKFSNYLKNALAKLELLRKEYET